MLEVWMFYEHLIDIVFHVEHLTFSSINLQYLSVSRIW